MEIAVFLLVFLAIIYVIRVERSRVLIRRFLMLSIALLMVPVAADIVAKRFGLSGAAGFNILLYWPFHFAYIGFAIICFTLLGWFGIGDRQGKAVLGAAVGAVLGVAWCILAFFLVLQIHLMGGGKI